MYLTKFSAIIEVANTANGKDDEMLSKAIKNIPEVILTSADLKCVMVVRQWDTLGDFKSESNKVRISHFGYDYRCAKFCAHSPESYGVTRYFAFDVLITSPTADMLPLLDSYCIPNCNATLTLCGYTEPIKIA